MRSVELSGAEVRMLENPTTGDKLHVIAARGMVFSSWRPSPEEKAQLMNDKPVWVIMRGTLVPEFILTVGDRNQVVPPEIIKRAQRNDELLNTQIGKKVVAGHQRQEFVVGLVAGLYACWLVAVTLYAGYIIGRFIR